MAYSKSKDSYPAWVHAFVPMLARCTEAGITTPREVERDTEVAAKKARFELYGFINALDREEPKKGQDARQWAEDKRIAQLARQWAISLSFNEHTGKWILTLKQKNTSEHIGAIADVIAQMEEELKQKGVGMTDPASPQILRERIPDIHESLARQAQTRADLEAKVQSIAQEDAQSASHPPPAEFYQKFAERYLTPEVRAIVAPYYGELPNPFASYAGKDSFTSAMAQALGKPDEEFFAIIGLRTYASMVWDNARIIAREVQPAVAHSAIRG